MLKNLKRSIKFLYQRITRGFSDNETWNLDRSFARLMIPRLKRFKELNNGYPDIVLDDGTYMSLEKWDKIIDEMIEGFEIIASDDFFEANTEQYFKAQQALDLFARYCLNLWW